jgi:hypothetical protein
MTRALFAALVAVVGIAALVLLVHLSAATLMVAFKMMRFWT